MVARDCWYNLLASDTQMITAKRLFFTNRAISQHPMWENIRPGRRTCRQPKSHATVHRRDVIISKRHNLTSNSLQTPCTFQSAKILVSSSGTVHFHLRWSFTAVCGGKLCDFVCRNAYGMLANLSGSFSDVFPWGKGLFASVASEDWFTVHTSESDFHWKMSLRIKSMFLHFSVTA